MSEQRDREYVFFGRTSVCDTDLQQVANILRDWRRYQSIWVVIQALVPLIVTVYVSLPRLSRVYVQCVHA